MGFQPTITIESNSGNLKGKKQRLSVLLVGKNAHPTQHNNAIGVVANFFQPYRRKQDDE
ncbi:MAG: hypothetical protein IJ187_06795 [Neisseriaceae bacterium]|nr:hypothetical protein [Neisseriaceae bacterium]